MSKTIALSYSRKSTFDKCRRKFDLQYNKKAFPDDSNNPAFIYGNEKHSEADNYVTWRLRQNAGIDEPMPFISSEVKSVVAKVDRLFDLGFKIKPELKLAIDTDYKQVSWFDRSVYYRCIIDLLAIKGSLGIALDYKTGKVYDYDEWGGQLHTNAMFIFCLHPQVTTVKCAYLYLDHKQTVQVTIHRNELPKLKKYYRESHNDVNNETEWPPTRNRFCYFCPATQAQCELK